MGFYKGVKFKAAAVLLLLCQGYFHQAGAQTKGTNYVRTRIPQIPVTDTSVMDTIPVQRQAVSIQYSDALGRAWQSVQVQGSAGLMDMIMPYAYDNMGRASKAYLPYADEGTSGATKGTFRSSATTNAVNFYNPASPGAAKMATDASPFAQTVYEASPLGRVNEQGEVGTVYQPGTGHTVRMSYQVNGYADPINDYLVSGGVVASIPWYNIGTLAKTIVTDENGHRTVIYKDLQGRVVTRAQLDAPTPYYSTDYVYNDLNQLINIIPPAAIKQLDFNRSNFQQIFANLGYTFRYDSIGRVVEKKVPGKGWVYTVYNHSDQPVLSQDSNMRVKNQWSYMKYDAEGRIVQTGIYINKTVTGRKALQALCDNNYPILWETWQPGTGYTNNAFPQQSAIPGASPLTNYTIYYYDDYTFTEAASKPFQANVYNTTPTKRTMGMMTGTSKYVLGTPNQRLITVNYYDTHNRLIQQIGDNHLGQVDVINSQYSFVGEMTGSQRVTTAIAGSPVTVKDRYVYDNQSRLMDTYESFQGGAEIDISHNAYNEIGQKVSEGLHDAVNYVIPNSQPAVIATITENTALTAGKSDIAGTSVTLSPGFSFVPSTGNSYLALIGGVFAQAQEFRYDIKKRLTNINNGTLTNDNGVTQIDPNPLFGESITYEGTSSVNATPQFNGNISGIIWRNKIEQTGLPGLTTGGQGYAFNYDNVNRLKQSSYYTQSGSTFIQNTSNALTEKINGYDEMGNIDSLQRRDKNGSLVNNLTYTYNYQSTGNQLQSVSDGGSQNITGTYTYDGNGNMTADSRKNVTITYNYLDLPDTVKQGTSRLVFTYDAAGNKLYKQLIVGGTVTSQRHYVEDEELTATTSISYDGKIESIAMDEGRIVNTGSNVYQYEYYMQDHLYTNRVTFRPNSDGTINLATVQNYYPFGANMGDATMNYSVSPQNLHLYEGNELQPELNLNTYDFGARHYDATLGRWMAIDPLSEQSEELSPYNYVENNPMNLMDPDGMQANGDGFHDTSLGEDLGNSVGSNIPKSDGSGGGLFGKFGGYGAAAGALVDIFNASKAFSYSVKIENVGKEVSRVQGNALPQATISAWQPNGFDKWKASGSLGKFTYDITDQAYVALKSVFWPVGEVSHLNGEWATPKDKQNAFVFTAASFIPLGKGSFALKAAAENIAEHGAVEITELAAPKLLTAPVRLTQKALDHIIERHWFTSGAKGAGKFAQGTTGAELKNMIQTAVNQGIIRSNSLGRAGTIAEFNFGKVIGTTSKGAVATSIRVVFNGGQVVTAFPF